MSNNTKAQQAIEETEKPIDGQEYPPAGPHDKNHLQDEGKTSGAGTLPDKGDERVRQAAADADIEMGAPEVALGGRDLAFDV